MLALHVVAIDFFFLCYVSNFYVKIYFHKCLFSFYNIYIKIKKLIFFNIYNIFCNKI